MIDTHLHTKISPDAVMGGTVLEYCQQARKLGLTALAVTEHCEVKTTPIPQYPEISEFNYLEIFEKAMTANTLAKEQFPELISGVELGQATQDPELAEKIISDPRLDFTIGSIHEVPGRMDFAFINYREVDLKTLLRDNFLEILKLCKWGKFDVLGHLTYVLRYLSKAGMSVDIAPYNDIIAESFKELVKKGKGIEINTSGLRQPAYGKTFPTLKYIKLFRDLGGEVITVGSDSHITKDVGAGVKEGIELAKAAGFDYLTLFYKHSPKQVKIC